MTKANIFMAAGWAGLASMVLLAIGSLVAGLEPLTKVGGYMTFLCCWTLLFTRNADEYTRGLWTSAASLAFATLLVLFIALPAAEGFYDGVRESIEDRERDFYTQDISAEAVVVFAIVAFYAGLFWKRFRGGF